MSTVRLNLKAVRANADKSQDEWAELLGVTRATVNNWESGKTQPKIEQVRMMSEIANIPIDCIFFE